MWNRMLENEWEKVYVLHTIEKQTQTEANTSSILNSHFSNTSPILEKVMEMGKEDPHIA